jgi:serine/threonine protein kinase
MTGKILHRDISENNIIISDRDKADGFSGILIDLDLAKEVHSGRSGARHQTGTMEFMAIDVLRQADHTYRHDSKIVFLRTYMDLRVSRTGKRVWVQAR